MQTNNQFRNRMLMGSMLLMGAGPSGRASSSPPAAPVLVVADLVYTDTPFTLEWDDVATATGYDLYRSEDNVTFALLAGDLATSTYDRTETGTGTTWWYVVAKNGAGASDPSNTEEVLCVAPASDFYYLRPGGVDGYLRFGTVDTYIRP